MSNNTLLPSNEGKQPKYFYGYTIIVASFFILMIAFGTQASFGVFFKPLLTEFGWTRATTSGAFSLYTILLGVFGIISGRISDRFGPRLILTVCGLLIGLGLLLMSRVHAIWQIYLFYGVLVSMGMSGIWVPLASTVNQWFPRRKGLAIGVVSSGIGVGIIIIPPLTNLLISNYNWRTSYIILGFIAMVFIVIVAQFQRRAPRQGSLLTDNANALKTDSLNLKVREFSLREAIRTRQFRIICVMLLCFGFLQQTVMVHIVAHATDIRISAAAAATILSIIGLVGISGKLIMGSLGDRIGRSQLMIMVFILLSLSFFGLIFANELWMLYLFAVVYGLGYGGFSAAYSPLVADYFGLKALGAIFGLASMANSLGGALGPLTAGRIFDISGSYHRAFILCAVLATAALIMSISLKAARTDKN